MALDRFSRGALLALGGSVAMALGSPLPWLEATILARRRSATGIEMGAGWGVLVAAGVVAVAVYAGSDGWYRRFGVGALGFLTAALGVLYINEPGALAEFDSATEALMTREGLRPAIGIYVVLAGGVLVVAGALEGLAPSRTGGEQTSGDRRSGREDGSAPASSAPEE